MQLFMTAACHQLWKCMSGDSGLQRLQTLPSSPAQADVEAAIRKGVSQVRGFGCLRPPSFPSLHELRWESDMRIAAHRLSA